MISTLGVVIIAVGASVSFFIGAAISIILVLRANDRKRRNKEEATRQFSAGQRGRLSVGSTNYSHVPEPRANLRRSTHLPFGVVSEGWAAIRSQETLPQYQRTLAIDHPGAPDESIRQKRRRSLRASFSAHSFSVPKTRRQKKIEKAIPLRTMPLSPLSAITEQSGTNTTEASPSVGIAELPTEITPKNTPDKDGDSVPIRRPMSPQWPLTSSERVSCNASSTIIPVPTGWNSTLVRMNSTGSSISPSGPSLGPRSISMTSTFSIAPEDPLPPLPSITPNQWPIGPRSRLRLSAASVDTIGSSVLGGEPTSPSRTGIDATSIGPSTPIIDLNPTGLQSYSRECRGLEPATVVNTGSPQARHATKYRSGKAGYGSLRASIGNHSRPQNTKNVQISDWRGHSTVIAHPNESELDVVDPVKWRLDVTSRADPVKLSTNHAVTDLVARTGSGYKTGTVAARHSMYEQYSAIGRLTSDSDVLRDVSSNLSSPPRLRVSSRPASIASENPFHWDRHSLQSGLSSSFGTSPSSLRKGHKRQNCVRISNIPAVDPSRRASKLPHMTEEEEGLVESPTTQALKIPGLTLLEQQKECRSADSGQGQGRFDSSPSVSGPVLEPTSWKRPKYSRASSSESKTQWEPDCDVFSNSRYNPNAPNIFTETSTPQRQWPLSPTTPYRAKTYPTPPSVRAVQEPYDPDSPTLPMPVISSATLFARALPLGSRISGVQGPRNIPIPARSARNASPSPHIVRAAAKCEDLRRPVISLRRMSSDDKDKTRTSHTSRNFSGEHSSGVLNPSKTTEQGAASPSSDSAGNVSNRSRSPNALKVNLQIPNPNDPPVLVSPSVASTLTSDALRSSKSRNRIAPSPSTMSAAATSIWEDASVRGDSSEPELPTSSKLSSPHLVDVEAYENFIGQDTGSPKDRDREKRLTSPQGKGLGLVGVQVQGKIWGTPGSLYDGDGFLRE